ncbi:MAG: type IX secretion system membrane protein PorP/SprF [Bacteroidales bacterium]|nr:type IX secretion system membrane protein PorP/SprF [Bacteroidales bacterium]
MKKFYILFLVFAYFSFQIRAQHVPLVTQFELNKNLINPAAFSNDELSINLFYRNQWTGFEDAPLTMGINAMKKFNNMNFGLFLINDKAGVFEQNTIHLNYAYDLQVAEKMLLSFGISGGVDLYAINYPELYLRQSSDPFLMTDKNNTALPDFNLGLMLHSANSQGKKVYSSTDTRQEFYAGISIQHILGVITLNDITKNGSYLLKHYNLMGGYLYPVNKDVGLEANVLLKYVKDVPFQASFGVRAIYKKAYWGGISYRSSNDIILKLGLYISQKILVGYSFDLVTSSIPSKTSHEFVLGYRLNNSVIVPKY